VQEYLSDVGGKSLKLVGGADDGQSGQFRQPGGEPFRKAGRCIEAGADRGPSLGDSEQCADAWRLRPMPDSSWTA
jgi:hypothetical protein